MNFDNIMNFVPSIVKHVNPVESYCTTVTASFDDMGLNEDILRGIYAYGFEAPSAIQQRAILPIINGHDTIAQAQSGTGKTATFTISALQSMTYQCDRCQALILAPTRELAHQIQKVVVAIGDYTPVKVHACVGGTAIREDLRILKEGVHIVVGTPGRCFDMINRGALNLDNIKLLILD